MVIEEERQVHPKDKANFISRLTLWWVFGLIWKGQSRPLVSEDLYAVRDEDRAERLTRRLQEKWENEKSQARKLQKVPRMWKALLFFFARKDYWFITMTICIHLIARNVAWFSTIKLLALIGRDLKSGVPYDKCLVYLWGIALGYLILSISVNHFHLYGSVLGIRARAAVVALLYKKVLCLGKCRVTPGHVMELICDDSQRLVTSAEWHIQDGIRTVSYCLCAIGWLYYFVGWEVLPVCLLSIFVGLYRLFISNIDSKLRSSASRLADKRLGYLREMFTGIRSIKLNCLENIIEERIHQTRRREVKYKTIRWIIMTLCYSFSSYGKQLTIFLVITLLMFMESSPISYEAVSSLLVLTNEVTKGLMLGIPTCIRLVIDVQTSLQRIQDFLEIGEERGNFAEKDPSEDDFDIFHNIHEADDEEFFIRGEGKPTTVTTSQQNVSNSKKGYKTKPFLSLRDITCKHPSPVASFIQLDSNDAPSLNFINLDISEPGLVVITGPVGSGKSSLLTSVLSGELLVTNGAVAHSGKLAYVSETPWVFPGTIRENILFGLDYSELRYLQAIKACQLERDLQSFPEGDLSRIGEHGATLSGGQRTRISLARAVYSQGDLYLLDDPLSSLDAKVGAEVFRKCIRGLLNNRIVLLVTNMVQYIKEADYVVKLQTGFIVAQGCLESVKEKVLDKIADDHLYGAENDELHPVKHLEEEKDESKKHKSTGMLVHEDKEDREIGGVSFKIYREYFLCGVPVLVLLMVVLTYVAGQVLVVLLDIKVARLSKQSNEGESGLHVLINYSILLMATIILISISITGLLLVPTNAAYAVHQKMVNCLIKAPLSFYAANPVGRLINRFSQDINNLDEFLPMFLTIFCLYLAPSVAAIVLASISTPKLIPFSLVACLVVFFSLKIYLRSGMDLKRLMTIAGGPLYSHFSNTMEGIRTIRVYNKQRDFETKVLRLIDHHGRALLAYYTVVRWFSITLDILAVVFVAIVVVFLVFLMNGSSDSGVVAIAIIYATNTVQVVQYIVRMIAEVSAQMTSAERALAYTKIKPEKGRDTKKFPSEIWPSRGGIQFENVSLRHCEDSPNVLHNLTFKIDPFEKIGVAGRTGAGKSSLIASLMRLADEIDGEIIIDNVNIKEMNVQSTRKAISVISQDPVLISGSIRSVLDPFKLFNDCEIWDALERMQIKSLIFSLPQQLNNDVAPSRSGFSIGERQLLHMARILLEKNKIIVFDEATGKVDRKTNERIQEIVSKVFHDCTVLTVAHRLDTILNCDRIMVLDQGKIVEFDRPDILLAKENGLLRQLYNISSGK